MVVSFCKLSIHFQFVGKSDGLETVPGTCSTIRFNGKPKSMDDLFQSGFSITIRFNEKPESMDDLC